MDIQLCSVGAASAEFFQIQEVDVCVNSSIDSQFQLGNGYVKAKTGKCLDRNADRCVNQQRLDRRLVYEGNLHVGISVDLKGNDRRHRTAEEVL